MSKIHKFDRRVLEFIKKYYLIFARLAIFIVYFWFGALKLFDLSPANPLVKDLLARTLPFISFGHFIFLLGLFEMLIGVLFLIHKMERVVALLLVIHMI